MFKQYDLIVKLYEIEAIKFGNFTLKSGLQSPIYIDLRLIVSYPNILHLVGECIWEKIRNLSFDIICGVPYTALPIATAISLQHQIPMVMRRKEIKEYGTKKTIEGAYQAGQKCLIIEDVITSGMSVTETIDPLEHEQLTIQDIAVLIDREQGGKQILGKQGYHLHSVFTLSQVLSALEGSRRIDHEMAKRAHSFIRDNQVLASA